MAENLSYNPYRDMHDDVQLSAMFFGKNIQNIPIFNPTLTIEVKRLYYSLERFTFTGKERDSETGLSYFGARYYDSDILTGWLSVDPMADKYPNISPYAYCNWNPVKLKDQDGEAPVKAFVTAAKLVKKAYNIYKKTGKLTASSLKKVGLDELIGIADDINTIFSGDASLTDRMAAAVDLLAGIELNNKGVKNLYQ